MPPPVAGQALGQTGSRLLVVDSMTPDPLRDSGSLRLCRILELLHQAGWQIDLVPDDGYVTQQDMERMASLGVSLQPGNVPAWLRWHGQELDAVLLSRLPIADQYLSLVKQLAPQAKVIFDTVDLHYVREERAAALTGHRRQLRQAQRSRSRELRIIAAADLTLVVSAEEKDAIAVSLPGSKVELLSNIHDVYGRQGGFADRRDLLFVGGFGHPPNADAVHWFVDAILPRIRQHQPDLSLHVVGDIDESSRRELERPGVVVHGRVPDLRPLLNKCRMSVAPLRFGAGVKGKVNQSMSHGLPVVLTSMAAEGMHLQDGVNALIANETTGFAEAVMRLYHDEALWLRLSDAGLANVEEHFSLAQARQTLQRVLPAKEVHRG